MNVAYSMPGVALPAEDETSIVHGLRRKLFVKVIETRVGFCVKSAIIIENHGLAVLCRIPVVR